MATIELKDVLADLTNVSAPALTNKLPVLEGGTDLKGVTNQQLLYQKNISTSGNFTEQITNAQNGQWQWQYTAGGVNRALNTYNPLSGPGGDGCEIIYYVSNSAGVLVPYLSADEAGTTFPLPFAFTNETVAKSSVASMGLNPRVSLITNGVSTMLGTTGILHFVVCQATAGGNVRLAAANDTVNGDAFIGSQIIVTSASPNQIEIQTNGGTLLTYAYPGHYTVLTLRDVSTANGSWQVNKLAYGVSPEITAASLTITQAHTFSDIRLNSASAQTVTVDNTLNVGDEFNVIQMGTGAVSVVADGSVIFKIPYGTGSNTAFQLASQFSGVAIKKIANETYLVSGDYIL